VRRQAQHPVVRLRAGRVVVDPHGLRGGDGRHLILIPVPGGGVLMIQ